MVVKLKPETKSPLQQLAPTPRPRALRGPPASRRAHAPPPPRQIHRPGKTSRPRQTPPHSNRNRQPLLDALLGTPRLRQNPSPAPHRPPHQKRFHSLQRCHQRHKRNKRSHGRSRKKI